MIEALEAALEVSPKLLAATPEALSDPYDWTIPLLSKEGSTYVWNVISLPACYPSLDVLDNLTLTKLAKACRLD